MYRLILLLVLFSEVVFAECSITGPGKKLPMFEILKVQSAEPFWLEYSAISSNPQISDDYKAPLIKDHCIVTLKNVSFENQFATIQWKGCSELQVGKFHKYHVYEICSEWGKDFYSFLGLKGAIIKSSGNEI